MLQFSERRLYHAQTIPYRAKPARRHGIQSRRPKAKPRACFNGIMWVLRTGARWKELPRKYPPKSTCHDRLKEWTKSGLFDQALERLLGVLEESEILDLTETFADGTFASAKKGINRLDRHAVAKELRL